jgi:hypothetical protein
MRRAALGGGPAVAVSHSALIMNRKAFPPAIAMALAACLGCMTAGIQPSETLTSLSPGAEQWFKIDWEAVPRPDDTVRLDGFIRNTYGTAARVRLLAQALDSSGKVVAQKLWWLDTVPGFGQVSYRIPGLPRADHYRVTVWSYTRIESDDIFFPR